ncbi:hypothetical protein [Candidatus Hydrogenosomobacter endosymbioticus]|uniref:Chromosome partition protein Smc n=1 Tax=Candidatus Hydrogenosomobacter endosymbioticus TaxID=2558174 RepID=A0ABM7V9U0_9PROT|nr:hypothetical protein [Candidatus Hydrogenosomobacter endosymbioticus]BDB96564.1 hypothetical protein HYD_6970 [Candidatus Hydrogenosomobacter endosymbioticus]
MNVIKKSVALALFGVLFIGAEDGVAGPKQDVNMVFEQFVKIAFERESGRRGKNDEFHIAISYLSDVFYRELAAGAFNLDDFKLKPRHFKIDIRYIGEESEKAIQNFEYEMRNGRLAENMMSLAVRLGTEDLKQKGLIEAERPKTSYSDQKGMKKVATESPLKVLKQKNLTGADLSKTFYSDQKGKATFTQQMRKDKDNSVQEDKLEWLQRVCIECVMDINSLKSEIKDLKSRGNSAQKMKLWENGQLERQGEFQQKMMGGINELRAGLAKKIDELGNSQSESVKLGLQVKDETTNLRSEMKKQTDELKAQKAVNKAAQDKANDACVAAQSLRDQIAAINKNVSEQKEAVKNVQNLVKNMSGDLQRLQQRFEDQSKQVQEARNLADGSRVDIQQLQQRFEVQSRQLQEVRNLADGVRGDIQHQLVQVRADLQNQTAEIRGQIDRIEQIQNLQQEQIKMMYKKGGIPDDRANQWGLNQSGALHK